MAPHWQPGRYLLPLSPFQWVFFTPSTSPTRCQVSDSFRCGVGLRACDGEVPRNVIPSTWPMLNLVDLDDSELVWPNTRELTKPPNNPQPKKTNKRQICWVSATEPSWAFRSSWPAGVWIDIKNARKTSLWSLNRLNTRQVLSILLHYLPNQKTKHPITFCCTICSNFPVSPTQVLQSFVRSPSPIPAEKFPTDLGFWSLRSSPAKHPSDVLARNFWPQVVKKKEGRWRMSQNKFVSWPKFEIQTKMERCKF